MNPAPLPQPEAQTCPNCGAGAAESVRFCPRCGAALTIRKSGGCLIIGFQTILVLLALIFGLTGACFVILGGTGGAGTGASAWVLWMGGGVVGLALAAACVWGIKALGKRLK